MRRALPWLWNGLAALSLLLCVAAAVLWLRSYWVADRVAWAVDGPLGPIETVAFSSECGRIAFIRGGWWSPQDKSGWAYEAHAAIAAVSLHEVVTPVGDPPPVGIGGFQWLSSPRIGMLALTIPTWFVALSLSALPLSWTMRRQRRLRRARRGLCPACGYDLRASPGRCPECGTPVTSAAAGR